VSINPEKPSELTRVPDGDPEGTYPISLDEEPTGAASQAKLDR